MLEGFGIGDPAATARGVITGALVQRFGVREMNRGQFHPATDDPTALAAAYRGIDLVVDVRTLDWGLIAGRDDRQWLKYDARLRLIDGRTGAVLAEATCSNPEPRSDIDQPPVFLAWTYDAGALLKQELWATSNRCISAYLSGALRM